MIKTFLQHTTSVPETRNLLRVFYQPHKIVQLLSEKYPAESFSTEKISLIFDTPRQHTWLVSTDDDLMCIIDNRSEYKPRVMWRVSHEKLQNEDDIEIEDISDRFGIIKVGNERVRKYSRSLYDERTLREEINKLIGLSRPNIRL